MTKYILIITLAILMAVGLTLVVAVSEIVSPVFGVVLEMVIMAGYLTVCALVADKIAERKEKNEKNVEI